MGQQRLAILVFVHFLKSTPTAVLEVAFGLMQLDLLAMQMTSVTAEMIRGRNRMGWDRLGFGRQRGHMIEGQGRLDDWYKMNKEIS